MTDEIITIEPSNDTITLEPLSGITGAEQVASPTLTEQVAQAPTAPQGDEDDFDPMEYLRSVEAEREGTVSVEELQRELALTRKQRDALANGYRQLRQAGYAAVNEPQPVPPISAVAAPQPIEATPSWEQLTKDFLAKF